MSSKCSDVVRSQAQVELNPQFQNTNSNSNCENSGHRTQLWKTETDRQTHRHITASFPGNLSKLAPERLNILDFNEARDDGVAVASAGPHANHLYLTPDRCQYLITEFFTGRMLFLMSTQQWHSTEGNRMSICWFANKRFKPQVCVHYSNCCYLSTAFGRV